MKFHREFIGLCFSEGLRAHLCATREGRTCREEGARKAQKGLLGIGGSWAAKRSGGATKSSAPTELEGMGWMRPSSIDIFYGTQPRYQARLLLSDAAPFFRPVREAGFIGVRLSSLSMLNA
jgi:hypothetical protein